MNNAIKRNLLKTCISLKPVCQIELSAGLLSMYSAKEMQLYVANRGDISSKFLIAAFIPSYIEAMELAYDIQSQRRGLPTYNIRHTTHFTSSRKCFFKERQGRPISPLGYSTYQNRQMI